MNQCFRPLMVVICSAVVALSARPASGTQVRDLVRLKGHEQNVLTGMGLVVGLDGTGDQAKDSLVAARPFAALLENLGDPVASLDELDRADSYAVVMVTMRIPATGAREGDRLDVFVDTFFNAESLRGGRLVVSMLRVPGPDDPDAVPLAFAEGSIVIEGANPRSGVVRSGGQMRADIRTNPVTMAGTITLVLKDQYAGYPTATTLAHAINDEFFVGEGFADIAAVEDAKNIKILVPRASRHRAAEFIAALMTIPIDPTLIQPEARIVINRDEGIIVVTGNVEIGPVGITHRGLSISSAIAPAAAVPAGGEPGQLERRRGMDTTERGTRNSTRLEELLTAFDQLNVPVDDQIAIIYELRKTGSLHAEIVAE